MPVGDVIASVASPLQDPAGPIKAGILDHRWRTPKSGPRQVTNENLPLCFIDRPERPPQLSTRLVPTRSATLDPHHLSAGAAVLDTYSDRMMERTQV